MQDRRPPGWRKFHPWQISRTYVRLPGERHRAPWPSVARSPEMRLVALDQSVGSELLNAFKSTDGVDLNREAVLCCFQELVEV